MDSNDIFHALGRIEATQVEMRRDIADIKEGVSDYRSLKNRLAGVCVIVSALAGAAWNLLLRKTG